MKATKKTAWVALLLALSMTCITCFVGCDNTNTKTPDESTAAPIVEETFAKDTGSADTLGSEDSSNTTPVPTNIKLELKGSSYAVSKSGCITVQGNVLTITKGGTYEVFGTLANGQLRIAVEKTEKVELIFAGVSITNNSSAPLYVESADKVSIELKAGTENTLTDALTYRFPAGEDKPNACLYSSEDLTIEGEGKLTVNAQYNNGIATKNDLKIKNGNITVTAANNALKGNQSVVISGGTLHLNGADGIKSDSQMENEGWIEFLGGNVEITCSDDGIQAVSYVLIKKEATVTVTAADKDVNCDGETDIAEGALISK